MMLTCIKQRLSNIWSSIYEKLRNGEAELKKSAAYKKRVYFKIWLVYFHEMHLASFSTHLHQSKSNFG